MTRRDLAWLAAVVLPLCIDCAACWPAILGRNDPASISRTCPDGTTCPAAYECPAPFSKGPCEWHSRIEDMGATGKDAGR